MTYEELVSAMLGATVGMVVVLLLCLYGCADDTDLSGACGDPCKTGSKGNCANGVIYCNEDGVKIGCLGEPAVPEECNGIDDDCDGYVDDVRSYRNSEWDRDEASPCGPPTGVCEGSYVHCRDGAWACQVDFRYAPTDNTCDLLDNDCDGDLNEDYARTNCAYPWPEETLFFGPCRAGVVDCVAGQEVCRNQQGPELEAPCDGIDNDCNGLIDDAAGIHYDVVLVMDLSGSMSIWWPRIRAGIDAIEATDTVRWALVLSSQTHPYSVVYEYGPLDRIKNWLTQAVLNGGAEWPLEPISAAVAGLLPVGEARPGAIKLTLNFSDEPPQPSDFPPFCHDGVNVHSTPFHFGYQELGDWHDYIHPCGGDIFDLNLDDVYDTITTLVAGGICQ